MKQLMHRVMDRLGIEINRSTTLRRFFGEHHIDLVIDAGANLGQFAQLVRNKGYHGRIWSFEPVPSVFTALHSAARNIPNWEVSQFALGNADGMLTINVPSNHSLSSFLKPSELLASYDTVGGLITESVEVKRLDKVLHDDQAKQIFLKADVQGFEKQVLDGSTGILDRVHAIYIELPIAHLYEGGWTFGEAISYLDGIGFTPAQFRSVNSMMNDRASAVEFDCLFRRK